MKDGSVSGGSMGFAEPDKIPTALQVASFISGDRGHPLPSAVADFCWAMPITGGVFRLRGATEIAIPVEILYVFLIPTNLRCLSNDNRRHAPCRIACHYGRHDSSDRQYFLE